MSIRFIFANSIIKRIKRVLTGVIGRKRLVVIGKKPVRAYVIRVMLLFLKHRVRRVVLRARGKNISKAVTVAEVVRNRSRGAIDIENIEIDTDVIKVGGRKLYISVIIIILGLRR